jgi:uncharacterized protein with HEPN domain
MVPTETDRLRHMRDAANAALSFIQGRGRPDLDSDAMLTFALIRAVEIIGEAATRLPGTVRDAHPEIPWGQIVGMRIRLVHGYYDVDLDVLWATVSTNLAPLIAALEAMLSPPAGP